MNSIKIKKKTRNKIKNVFGIIAIVSMLAIMWFMGCIMIAFGLSIMNEGNLIDISFGLLFSFLGIFMLLGIFSFINDVLKLIEVI